MKRLGGGGITGLYSGLSLGSGSGSSSEELEYAWQRRSIEANKALFFGSVSCLLSVMCKRSINYNEQLRPCSILNC